LFDEMSHSSEIANQTDFINQYKALSFFLKRLFFCDGVVVFIIFILAAKLERCAI